MSEKQNLAPELKLATTCLLVYVSIYAFEAPIRYLLNFGGLVQIILLRDLLIDIPFLLIVYRQMTERRLHPALQVFAFLIAFQGTVFYLNFHSVGPVLLGAKILVNTTLGFIIGESLMPGNRQQTRYITVLLVVSFAGLIIEKFVTRFPWVGMSTMIAGIEVPISVDWQVEDELTRRVGGFMRESINAASFMPFIGLLLAGRSRSYLVRFLLITVLVFSVLLTTQKGALVAMLLVGGCILLPAMLRLASLRILVLAGGVLQIAAPLVTQGALISEGNGSVFTASSIAARILYTWPETMAYLSDNSLGPFGAGIGGLGGPMRLIRTVGLGQVGDSMSLFLYAYLGIFAVFFYITVIVAVWRSLSAPSYLAEPALAICAFCLIYGAVITAFEDQILSLAIGLSLGALLSAKAEIPATAAGARARPSMAAST